MNQRFTDILDVILLGIAVPAGLASMQEIDLALAILLKVVSIISFGTIIIINWGKIKKIFK